MAWLGRQSTTGRRHSVGGAGQQNSLRDALRARGGAQNLPRATTDVEDNEDIPVKGSLDWLSLNPFAPKAMQGVVDRLKATGEGAMDRIKAGIGEDAVDRIKAGSAGAFDRFRAGAGAVLGGEFSVEDHPLSFSPPKRQEASSSEANGHKSTSGRKSTSLRSALQARGGIGRTSVGSSEAPETSDPVQEQADEKNAEHSEQPSLEKALSSPLPAVREDDEEESPQRSEQAPDDVKQLFRQDDEEVAKDGGDAAETKSSEDLPEEPEKCMESRHRESGDEEVAASPKQTEAESETAEALEAAREAEEDAASSAEVGGLEAAVHDVSLKDESVHAVAPETTKTERSRTDSHESPARNSRHASNAYRDSASRLPVPPPYVSRNLDEHAVVVQRQESSAEPIEPSGPPLLAPAPPLRRPDKESQDVGKLKELREFWGSKKSRGFAGPELGSSRLSKNEAQATLQRLIAAGGDFDEVRRLRKLIQELDQ
eukprot:TRINITY_DN11891_c0_g1_i4.p1 TRINITY_DN11891_c0_g1~~TRINITY_DN11891_c0_g1_i4.p1  ORF type:complete len:484 (+),score=127.97 TRINITY_DN11891_c0_g1_i4:128-1579(+)